jgi:hypothetical protein
VCHETYLSKKFPFEAITVVIIIEFIKIYELAISANNSYEVIISSHCLKHLHDRMVAREVALVVVARSANADNFID